MNTAARLSSSKPTSSTTVNLIRRDLRLSLAALALAGVALFALLVLTPGAAGGAKWLALIVLAGAAGVSMWSWRRLRRVLACLERVEGALDVAAQAAVPPARLDPDGGLPVARGYNALVNRMAQSETARMEFLADGMHQLRTPLTSILSYAELLNDPGMLKDMSEVQGWTTIIAREARQVDRLVEELITAATVESYPADMLPAPLRLEPFLASVTDDVREQTGRDILLQVSPQTLLGRGDALYLRRVLMNLLDNAVRFSPPDTSIRITARQADDGHWAEIAVADQGVGIAEADQAMLFQRFGRVRSERARSLAGGGLGLYIARQIMLHHGGGISVRSRPDQGAVFTVRLPLEAG